MKWASTLLAMAALALAQPAPDPGPEHKKLEMWVGSWSIQVDLMPANGYDVPAGKVNRTDRFQWLPGGFFLEHQREGKGPLGTFRHMSVIGYSPISKSYTWEFFDLNSGSTISLSGTSSGNSWKFSGSGISRAGKRFQERCTNDFTPSGSVTFKCETSPDGKTWRLSAEGKGTRSK